MVVSFLASFPPIQSAIKVGQDGMRIQLDIPESEMPKAIGLLGMRECVLVVTVQKENAKKTRKNRETIG